jgi:hypothetical protein
VLMMHPTPLFDFKVITLMLFKQYGESCWSNSMKDLRFSRRWLWRMPSRGILRHVALVRTEVSEKRVASIIKLTRISELGTTSAVSSYWSLLQYSTVLLHSMLWLLVASNVVVNLPILFTLIMEVILSS